MHILGMRLNFWIATLLCLARLRVVRMDTEAG